MTKRFALVERVIVGNGMISDTVSRSLSLSLSLSLASFQHARVYVCACVQARINNKWQNPSLFGGDSVAATVSAFTTCRCCYTLVASNSSRPPM